MQNKVPLPTDNIYKFFALFGLILFIFSLGATIYIAKEANVQLIDIAIQLDNTNNNFSDETKGIIEGYREVIVADREYFESKLVGLAMFGALLGLFGFLIWMVKIQPQQDKLVAFQLKKYKYEVEVEQSKKNEILELQIEKEKLEIEKIKKELQ